MQHATVRFHRMLPLPPLAVYASQDGSLRRHARLASGWLASLVRAGITTRWVLPKGFRLSILLPQASPGSPKFEYQKGPRRIVKIRYPTSGENRPSSFSARINASMHSAKSTGLGGSNPVCSSSQSAICGYPCIADEESRVHGRFCTRTGTGDAPGLSAPGILGGFSPLDGEPGPFGVTRVAPLFYVAA